MEVATRFILPVYFAIFFGFAFVLKSIKVAKKIGKNPLVLPKDDSVYGLVGLYFKLTMIGIFIYTVLYSVFPHNISYLVPIETLSHHKIKYVAMPIMFVALIWVILAQNHMKNSWRIGIDENSKSELITNGLFAVSRNPIFLGMIMATLGLFLLTPNVWTLVFFILGYVLIQIQIRLEEDFLTKQHGEKYERYKNEVRRFI